MKLILASASPRRREIFELLSIPFEIAVSKKEPPLSPDLGAEQSAFMAARAKAEDIFENNRERTVVGADTVVSLENSLLGKPKSEAEAKDMLKALSGRAHEVITAVYVCSPKIKKGFTVKTSVEFYPLSDSEIEEYVKTGEPMDKAGAYGIQGKALRFVKGICGDYYNVVGFPAAEFVRFLEREEL
ncbi:MAG: Maf family protein [Oscillospiraceae bacterium]|nr:Maf family protein [Oscillospiraceae bacterium]